MTRARTLSGQNFGPRYSFPMGAWFTLFFILPLAIIISYSFMKKGLHGGVELKFTLTAYAQMFNSSYGKLLVRTLWVTFLATVVSILLALPCGYAMARSKNQTFLLFLVIIPFWTNSLIRINAWIAILGNEGFINETLRKFGLITESLPLLYNQGAVILVMIYMYLPYAILPVFTAMDKFDFSRWKRRNLGIHFDDEGASAERSPHRHRYLHTDFGAYTVPLLVGKDSYMIGNVIVDQVTKIDSLASAFDHHHREHGRVLWMMGTSTRERPGTKPGRQTGADSMSAGSGYTVPFHIAPFKEKPMSNPPGTLAAPSRFRNQIFAVEHLLAVSLIFLFLPLIVIVFIRSTAQGMV